jgi:Peptidase family M28
VLSAHLDHLGVGCPIDNDTIYNGAMDNAAGVASLIEIAKTLSSGGAKPKRSILFLAWTGEEEGMLGSQYFVAHPTVPLGNIVAAINMDMYLPLFPLHYLEVQGLGESTLGNDIRAVAQRNDVEVQFDKQPPENRFIRSDQASFVKRGIPGLAFKFGWLPDSPEQKTFNEWIHSCAVGRSQPAGGQSSRRTVHEHHRPIGPSSCRRTDAALLVRRKFLSSFELGKKPSVTVGALALQTPPLTGLPRSLRRRVSRVPRRCELPPLGKQGQPI